MINFFTAVAGMGVGAYGMYVLLKWHIEKVVLMKQRLEIGGKSYTINEYKSDA